MATIKMSCIFCQVNIQNENMSSTVVDIVNNMPEKFNLDIPGRISDMTLLVQLWRNSSLFQIYDVGCRTILISRFHVIFQNRNISSTFVDIVNNMLWKFHLDMPGRISVVWSWVQLWRSASFVKSLKSRFCETGWAEFTTIFILKVCHQFSWISLIICQKIFT